MGIESTYYIKQSDAIKMLEDKRIVVHKDLNAFLADLLYENRESIFEKYVVVDDDFQASDPYASWKKSW